MDIAPQQRMSRVITDQVRARSCLEQAPVCGPGYRVLAMVILRPLELLCRGEAVLGLSRVIKGIRVMDLHEVCEQASRSY